MPGRKHLHVLLVLFSAIVGIAVGTALAPVEQKIADARLALRPAGSWPPDLAVVRIADPPPWSSEKFAVLLASIGAKTIAVDALLPLPADDASAETLAKTLERAVLAVPWVATSAKLTAGDAAVLDPSLVNTRAPGRRFGAAGFVVPPARYASAALGLGHAIAELDADGVLRSTRPLAAVAGTDGALPSAPFAAWLHHRGLDPGAVAATASIVELPDGSTLPLRVELDLRALPAPESSDFAGKLVVVCADASIDRARTPLGEIAGCDLFAAAVRTIDQRSWPRRIPVVPAVLALAAASLALKRRTHIAIAAAVWLIAAIAFVPLADLHLPVFAPLAVLAALAISSRAAARTSR